MKKKILIFLLVIVMVFTLTGCKKKEDLKKKAIKEGNIYNIVTLKDTVANVDAFTAVLPTGWKAYIESNWGIVNSSYPGLEKVVISNKDATAKITILSQTSYTENNKYNEGENQDYYTTYKRVMNASEYLDYYMSTNYSGASFVKNIDVKSDLLEQIKAYNDIRYSQAKQDAQTLGAESYGVTIDIVDAGTSASRKQYELGLNYIEANTAIASITTNLTSSLSSLLNSSATQWTIPYTIIYEGETKEAFDKYYDDYTFIVANASFTKDYYQMVEYVSSKIVNMYTAMYAAKAQAALDATNDYINSNYSSTSASSTNDKVMEMWDDVINEVDKYTLEDGSTLKTSIMNDTVAQNGNEIYIGSKAGIPYGFNEVSKGY